MNCPKCGKDIPTGIKYCVACGSTVRPPRTEAVCSINKPMSLYSILSLIISVVIIPLMTVLRLAFQQTQILVYSDGSFLPSQITYIPDNIRPILLLLVFALTILAIILAVADRRSSANTKIALVFIPAIFCLISLFIIYFRQ